MENLPQDIIFDILSRFSVKSVGRLRCVCKSWRSLISKPEFVKTHLDRASTEEVSVGCRRLLIPNYISKSGSKSLESIDYEALQLLSNRKLKKARQNKGGTNNACTVLDFPSSGGPERRVYLVGYCHGMVGMVVDYDKIVLCNPCTREIRELPKPSSFNPGCRINGGLGYDSSVDDYKFVIIAFDVKDDDDDSDCGIKAEIFSLRSNSWRVLHDIGPDIFGFGVCGSAVFLNGALHWIAYSPRTRQVIIPFDLATEKFQDLFPLPPDLGYKDWNLTVLGGYLSVSCLIYPSTHQVWVKKEYSVEASWTKLYALDIQLNKDLRFHYLLPLCFSNNGELLVNVDHHIIIYNPQEQTYRKLYKGNWLLKDLIVAYTESLVSPNGNVEYNYLMSKISSNSHRTKTKIEEC